MLPDERIRAVRTGCCPHTAIRDDITANLDAVDELVARHDPDLVLVESGGDNLTATFSYGLVHAQIFVLDVAGGDKVPRKGGPGVTRSDLLVINKIDLAPLVGADLDVMRRGRGAVREGRPTVLVSLREQPDAGPIVEWVTGLVAAAPGVTEPRHRVRRSPRPGGSCVGRRRAAGSACAGPRPGRSCCAGPAPSGCTWCTAPAGRWAGTASRCDVDVARRRELPGAQRGGDGRAARRRGRARPAGTVDVPRSAPAAAWTGRRSRRWSATAPSWTPRCGCGWPRGAGRCVREIVVLGRHGAARRPVPRRARRRRRRAAAARPTRTVLDGADPALCGPGGTGGRACGRHAARRGRGRGRRPAGFAGAGGRVPGRAVGVADLAGPGWLDGGAGHRPVALSRVLGGAVSRPGEPGATVAAGSDSTTVPVTAVG